MAEYKGTVDPGQLQDKYKYSCWKCGAILWAQPSSLMRRGQNAGAAQCRHCAAINHLYINDDNETMTAVTAQEAGNK